MSDLGVRVYIRLLSLGFRALAFRALGFKYINGILYFPTLWDSGVGGCYV